MISSSASGTKSLNTGDPCVVRMPAVAWVSLCTIGSPCSGPTGTPLASRWSASRAAARACSATTVGTALTSPSSRSIWSRCAVTTSIAESCRACSIRTISRAERKQISSVIAGPSLGGLTHARSSVS